MREWSSDRSYFFYLIFNTAFRSVTAPSRSCPPGLFFTDTLTFPCGSGNQPPPRIRQFRRHFSAGFVQLKYCQKMPDFCAAVGCSNQRNSKTKENGITFHRYDFCCCCLFLVYNISLWLTCLMYYSPTTIKFYFKLSCSKDSWYWFFDKLR